MKSYWDTSLTSTVPAAPAQRANIPSKFSSEITIGDPTGLTHIMGIYVLKLNTFEAFSNVPHKQFTLMITC